MSSSRKNNIAQYLGLDDSSDESSDVSEYSPHGNRRAISSRGKARSSRGRRLTRRLNLKPLLDHQSSDSSDDSASNEETEENEESASETVTEDSGTESAPTNKNKCQYCLETFKVNRALLAHEKLHLSKPYLCTWPKCTYFSDHRGNTKLHIRVKHFKLPATQKQQKAKGIVDDRDPNDYIEFVTARPQLPKKRGRPSKKEMEMKKKEEQKKKKKKLKEESRPVASPKGRPNSTASPLPCHFNQFDVCDEFFSTQADLDAHHRYHLCIRPYKCTWPRCSFRSETRAPILVHLKVHIEKGDGHNPEDYVDVDEEQLVSPI